ncbi:MAG: flagellar accessory protein FlaH [Methanomassiliicoccales archaeon PtaU1.Bin124]|nr:MAG: flagellar accessory protein FlaH [Methanomassiliicoccales archaeon PtaU1.Bin124]
MGSALKRIPTGVADFDSIIKGGIPPGAVVLLLGDLGAGQNEYVITSSAKLSLVKEDPSSAEFFLGSKAKAQMMPDKICYVTFSRSKDDVLQEIRMSFNEDFYDAFERNVVFKDFSGNYFRQTMVPRSWAGDSASALFGGGEAEQNLLECLVNYLDENAKGNMVIIDSLTDLLLSTKIETHDLVAVLKGMQRVSKKWGGVVYLLLTRNVVDDMKQRMIMDSVDGALVFEWNRVGSSSRRQRYLYVEKFMSILPHLDKERVARFATTVSSQSGLVVIDTERIV